MKRLLFVLVLLAVAVVGLGFYLGWFHFSTSGSDGKPGAAITVDPDKIDADKKAAQDKLKDLEEKAKEQTKPTPDKSKEEPPKP